MTPDCGFLTSAQPPELPAHLHETIALHGSTQDKWQLSGQENVTAAVFDILANDSDADVRTGVAVNYAAPAGTLASLASRHPELLEDIWLNRNAPPGLKELGPFCWQTEDSLEQFLADQGGTEQEALLLFKEHRRLTDLAVRRARKVQKAQPPGSPIAHWEPPGSPLLGEVWATIRPPAV